MIWGFYSEGYEGEAKKNEKYRKRKIRCQAMVQGTLCDLGLSAVVVVLSPTTAAAIEVAAAATAVVSLCSCLSKKRPPEGGPCLTIFFF